MLFPVTGPGSGYAGAGDGSISTLSDRNQENVTETLKAHVQASPGFNLSAEGLWQGLRAGISLPLSIIEGFIQNFLPFGLGDFLDIDHALDSVLDIGDNLFAFLGNLNPADPDFDIAAAAESFITLVLSPVNLLAELIGGFIPTFQIPGLDASKIISGLFDMSMIDGLLDFLSDVPILGDLVEAITGIFGGDLLDVSSWFDNLTALLGGNVGDFGGGFDLTAIITNFASTVLDPIGFFANLISGFIPGGQIPGLDASKITTGTFPLAIVDTAVDIADAAFGWLNGFFNAMTGQSSTTATVSEAATQAAALAEATLANAIALAKLQAESDGGVNSGLASSDDFERVDTGGVGSAYWSEVASASTATNGKYTLTDGHSAVWTSGLNGDQTIDYRRIWTDDMHTQTLYQKVGYVVGAFTGMGFSFGLSPSARVLRCRVNDANTQEVFCYITADGFAQFGYKNGGAKIMVGSPTYVGIAAPGTSYFLIAGTPGGVRQFQLVIGGNVVHSWNDSGALSAAVQGTNNGWGWGAFAATGGGSPQKMPSDVSIVTIADNVPATVPGTQFRAYRDTATTVNLGSRGPNDFVIDNGFFTFVDYITNDFSWDATNQILTCNTTGTYDVDISYWSDSGLNTNMEWNPVLFHDTGSGMTLLRRGQGAVPGTATTQSVLQCALSNLRIAAGEKLKPGIRLSTFVGANVFSGDTAGIKSYFCVAKKF